MDTHMALYTMMFYAGLASVFAVVGTISIERKYKKRGLSAVVFGLVAVGTCFLAQYFRGHMLAHGLGADIVSVLMGIVVAFAPMYAMFYVVLGVYWIKTKIKEYRRFGVFL